MSILIVDDVKSMRSIVRSLLKNLKIGQTFHMAENGVEGLKLLNTNQVDLAIIDWKMPVMNGTQLLDAIRKDRRLRDIPVIMVTAESEKEIVLEAAEIEVEAYLLKPLTPAVLEEKIRIIIDQINYPEEAVLHIRKARQMEESDDIDTAIKHMTCAAALKPGASRLQRNLGLLYQKAGNEALMEAHLKKAAAMNEQDVVTRRILGDFYWEKEDLLSAVCYYNDVVCMTHKFSDEALDLGEALLKDDQPQNAKLLFSGILSQAKKNLELMEKVVRICLRYDEHRYALSLLERMIRDFPSNMELKYRAGQVCELMDDLDKAQEYYLTVDKNQYSRVDVKLRLARILIIKKKVIQADEYINQILQKDPSNRDALQLRRLV